MLGQNCFGDEVVQDTIEHLLKESEHLAREFEDDKTLLSKLSTIRSETKTVIMNTNLEDYDELKHEIDHILPTI